VSKRKTRSRSAGKKGKTQAAITSSTSKASKAKSNNEVLPFPEIYWGGCAFGSAFYVGVYRALWEEYDMPQLLKNGLKVTGGSAGAMFAVLMALEYTPEEIDTLFRQIISKSPAKAPWHNPWTNRGASKVTEEAFLAIFEADPNVYKKIEGVVSVGTTQWYSKHAWHVSWENNSDLWDTLRGSMHVPFYTHKNVPIKGIMCVDGAYGFSGDDLAYGDATLYVGIDPHAEITRHFNYTQMFFPPQGQEYDDMVQTGYDATQKWLKIKEDKKFNKKVGPGLRQPNYEALRFLWVFKLLEEYLDQIKLVLVCMLIYWLSSALGFIGPPKPCCAHHAHH
jgi:hypothetical protein